MVDAISVSVHKAEGDGLEAAADKFYSFLTFKNAGGGFEEPSLLACGQKPPWHGPPHLP